MTGTQPTRTLVMGILNVTPDSFSDGGLWANTATAVDHGLRLVDEGADLVDVGGESTRPGATRPTPDEEMARVLPVVERLAARGVVVSVDTMRAEVAARAIDAGARIINDVSGGLADPGMLATVAPHTRSDSPSTTWPCTGATLHRDAGTPPPMPTSSPR